MTGATKYAALTLEAYQASTGVELAHRVATGDLSPVQLTECALHIASAAEPAINAYAALLPARALRQAAERESEAKNGLVRSALHGVPIACKDNFAYEGEPTWKGSRTSSDTPASTSAPMIARLLDAGTIIIGRTTTPEFGWKGTGISPRTGITRNPWNPACNSGGSSAGSAATVATGAVPIATGTDAGGSIRIPASFCGVVGLKPTLGAIPVWPGTVNEQLSHSGPITRSVGDARAVLDLTRGPDARDPQSFHSIGVAQRPDRRLRVGVIRDPFDITPDAGVDAVLEVALASVRRIDVADFTDVHLSVPLPRAVFETMWVTGRGLGFGDLIREHGDIMDPGLVRLEALAAGYTVSDLYAATTARRHFNASLHHVLGEWDLLVMPTMPITAFAADQEVPAGGEWDAPLPWITWTPYTYPFNVTGQPAVTVPCGFADNGLPVGMQIVGPWAHDDRVLDFAEACEGALAKQFQPIAPVAPQLAR